MVSNDISNDAIVRAAIHPAIGIARVGDSPEQYFIGPETLDWPLGLDQTFKDPAGALKRQAARFRIYGLDAQGKVVGELTAGNADITWTAHIANTKAAWYNFESAMDTAGAIPCARRNPGFTGAQRAALRIDPGPRTIRGMNRSGPEYQFDGGSFLDKPVYLGELRTDEAGRLLVLGGRGVSGTPEPYNTISTFANNRAWHDDVGDGPVTAEVVLGDRSIPVEPAWVVVAPPNYAPGILSLRTMYDVMFDAHQGWWFALPEKLSFTQHIHPILQRFCETQWVNFGFFLQFGWGGPYDFMRREFMAKLASNSPRFKEMRLQVFNLFRDPNATTLQVNAWPQMYGDEIEIPPVDPLSMLALTQTQYGWLQAWAAGNFEEDWNPDATVRHASIDEVDLESRPATLDRAALQFCLGGPFHPGCEMTWPMRHNPLYYAPFRIRPRGPKEPEPDCGDILTPGVAIGENGPLYSSGPGDITRWMAVPWQADTAGCRSGYTPEYDPYLPTLWPARAPNHVLTSSHFGRLANPELTMDERVEAFGTRASWLRWLDGGLLEQMQQMVTSFSKLGVVVRKEVTEPGGELPCAAFVETEVGFSHNPPLDRNTVNSPVGRRRRKRAANAAAST